MIFALLIYRLNLMAYSFKESKNFDLLILLPKQSWPIPLETLRD